MAERRTRFQTHRRFGRIFSAPRPSFTGGALAMVLGVGGFLAVALGLHDSTWLLAIDARLRALMVGLRAPGLTRLMWAGTVVGGTIGTIGLTAGLGLLLWAWLDRWSALRLVLTVALGSALVAVIKPIIHRQRPPMAGALVNAPGSFSFPSGHAMSGVAVFITLALVLMPVVRTARSRILIAIGGIAGALWVGASRIYLGVHWPTDVLASWCLGIATVAALAATFRTGRETRAPKCASGSPRVRLVLSGIAVALVLGGLALGAARDPLTVVHVASGRPPAIRAAAINR